MKKNSISVLATLCLFSSGLHAEVLKDVGRKVMSKEDVADVEKIIKCEKQKKCHMYIDMTTDNKEAILVVEAPEKFITTLNGKGGIQGYYHGVMMIAKNNSYSALQEFTNNKQVYKNKIDSGLNDPKSRMFIRINAYRIEKMNTLIIKDKDKILGQYTFEDSKK